MWRDRNKCYFRAVGANPAGAASAGPNVWQCLCTKLICTSTRARAIQSLTLLASWVGGTIYAAVLSRGWGPLPADCYDHSRDTWPSHRASLYRPVPTDLVVLNFPSDSSDPAWRARKECSCRMVWLCIKSTIKSLAFKLDIYVDNYNCFKNFKTVESYFMNSKCWWRYMQPLYPVWIVEHVGLVGGARVTSHPRKLDREIFADCPSAKIRSLENFRLYGITTAWQCEASNWWHIHDN